MTDQQLLQQCQYSLIEPPDGGQSWPSGLWARDEILSYLNQRQDQLLNETQLLVTAASLPVASGIFLVDLPADWLQTISLVWRGDDGRIVELQRVDSFEADHTDPLWVTVGATSPLFYMDEDVPGSLLVRIGPAPTGAGDLDLLYVATGTSLTGNGISLTVPDELAHAVKYGVLAEALKKDGRALDPARSAYCEQRVDLAKQACEIILQGWS